MKDALRHLAIGLTGAAALCTVVAAQDHKDRPPSVSIAASGSPYTTARTVPITVNASDDRGIRQVEFFDGGASKGIDTSAPYSVDWPITSAQNGVHNWWATATDTAGHRTDSATIYLTVTIATTTPSTTDPTWTFCASEGASCTFTGTHDVRYGANGAYATKTLTDGTVCSNTVFGDPIYGIVKHCDLGVLAPTPPPPPTPVPTSTYGQQSTITCPTPSVIIMAGGNIQAFVDANPTGTAFCLGTGTTFLRASIRPKSGDSFIGEYGAILDGTGWLTSDPDAAAFASVNQGIVNVTIRNLVIRNLSQNGVKSFEDSVVAAWVVEYCDISYALNTGVNAPKRGIVRHTRLHHNGNISGDQFTGGGYSAYQGDGALFEDNEISYNANEQKIAQAANVVFRRNWVHHNFKQAGIWYDGAFTGALVENNVVEDNHGVAIDFEMQPYDGTPDAPSSNIIRNNILRRNGDAGVLVSVSHWVEVYGNAIEDNYRGVTFYIDCSRIPNAPPPVPPNTSNLKHVSVHDNTFRIPVAVGGLTDVLAGALATAGCSSDYVNRLMDLTFTHNTYTVPALGGAYWLWNGMRTFAQWQALSQDVTGTIQ